METPVSFSELADALDAPDSGNLNYHLGELTDRFVRRTDAGYELRQTGRRVVSTILSGVFTGLPELAPTEVDAPCPYCGARIVITYAEERLLVQCTACGGSYERAGTAEPTGLPTLGTIAVFMLPPAGVEARSPTALLQAACNWDYFRIQSLAARLCPRCAGRVDIGIRWCEPHESAGGVCSRCRSRHAVLCAYCCEHCGYFRTTTPANHIMAQPPVAAFYHRHGVDVTELDWENARYLAEYDEEVLGRDPFRLQLVLSVGTDEFTVVLDGDLGIVDSWG